MHLLTASLLLARAIAVAVPDPQRAAAAPATTSLCDVVNKAITGTRLQSAATAYCSSYISIPVVTVEVVTATVTAFPADNTCYQAGAKKRNDETPENEAVQEIAKRQRQVPQPPAFEKYVNSKVISSACSCLSITPSTTIAMTAATVRTDVFVIKSSVNQKYATPATYIVQKPYELSGIDFSAENITTAEKYKLNAPRSYVVPCHLSGTYLSEWLGATFVASVVGDPDPDVSLQNRFGNYVGGSSGMAAVSCRIAAGSGVLTCEGPNDDILTQYQYTSPVNYPSRELSLLRLGDGSKGVPVVLTAIPVVK